MLKKCITKNMETSTAAAPKPVSAIIKTTSSEVAGENKKHMLEELNIKPLETYRRSATLMWTKFEKAENEKVPLKTISAMIQSLNIFMLETQAERLFKAVDVLNEGAIDPSEFETFLIGIDAIGPAEVQLMDVYDSLVMNVEKLDSLVQGKNKDEASSGEKKSKKDDSKEDKSAAASSIPDDMENDATDVTTGLDFSGFCEALSMFDSKASEAQIMNVFCDVLGCGSKDVPTKYLTYLDFKHAWVRLVSVENEMLSRNLKVDNTPFGMGRNQDRLLRAITEKDEEYLQKLHNVPGFVDSLRQEKRRKKDEKRIEEQHFRDRLLHEADLFSAIRAQEKRLLIKKEQEERSKKRIEDKVLRNQLLQRQADNKLKKKLDQIQEMKDKEQLRLDEIRKLGLDKMDFSVRDWRIIPYEMYDTDEARTKLSYVVYMNLSHNKIEWLPENGYFTNCASLRKLKLSQNRLHFLPTELCSNFGLEILSVDSNALNILPSALGSLTALQRLDLANNYLEELPSSLGECRCLRYMSVHSNSLRRLPSTIGHLVNLEHLNLSRNRVKELPEEFQYLIRLEHFDISTNDLTHLPYNIGHCIRLAYLDATSNQLGFLPESFAELNFLEICRLDCNKIILAPDNLKGLQGLKDMRLTQNLIREIYADIGTCANLVHMDLSNNSITILPSEIGLLTTLEVLNLSRNEIITLPPELGACRKLQKLDISHNKLLDCLPEKIGLVHSLLTLDVSFNQLKALPRSIIGLSALQELNCEGNFMSVLPDTITYLTNLKLIDLTNNKFQVFPMELSSITSLTTLNIADNLIPLLSRSINSLTYLTRLDLSSNVLKALPVEFADLVENVPCVLFSSNPWTDFPPIWSNVMTSTWSTECPNGYRVEDALDFMYCCRVFYYQAEQLWTKYGSLYYSNRLGLKDFVGELERMLNIAWHPGYEPMAGFLYFKAKEYGIFPRWYEQTQEQLLEVQHRKLADAARRDALTERVRQEEIDQQRRLAEIYGCGVVRRALRKDEMHAELAQNSVVRDKVAYDSLYDDIRRKREDIEVMHKRIENARARVVKAEASRLLTLTAEVFDSQRLASANAGKRKRTKKQR